MAPMVNRVRAQSDSAPLSLLPTACDSERSTVREGRFHAAAAIAPAMTVLNISTSVLSTNR